jgi:molybdopterin converting factor small subunit
MATVILTRHLKQLLPELPATELQVEGSTVAELVQALERTCPGIAFYLCDERGRLRQHVNVFIGEERIADRTRLSDPVAADARVFILQALSGG